MELVSALGHCTVHNLDKMSVTDSSGNEQLICVKCRAAGEVKTGRTQLVEDPGEAFNGFTGGKAKITMLDVTPGAPAKAPTLDTRYSYTVTDVVSIAIAQLRKLPMPEDIKEFKRVQKVIKTLQSLTENQNG